MDEITCRKCVHSEMCSAYKAMKLFKEQFDKEYKHDIKVSFPNQMEVLAENCKSFISIERGKDWR